MTASGPGDAKFWQRLATVPAVRDRRLCAPAADPILRPGPRVVAYTLLATVLSVIVQGTMMAALTPFGIPTLTAAFVLVTWLFLLPGLKLE